MKLTTQKRLAADILKCSPKRVVFDSESLESISEAITKQDVRALVRDGVISERQKKGISRVRANKRLVQRRKGLRRGPGSKKGTLNARAPQKQVWMNRIRAQRRHLLDLKEREEISPESYRGLYRKAKGGFFRSKRHITTWIEEQGLRRKTDGNQ